MGDRKPDMPEQGSVEKTEDYRDVEDEASGAGFLNEPRAPLR